MLVSRPNNSDGNFSQCPPTLGELAYDMFLKPCAIGD